MTKHWHAVDTCYVTQEAFDIARSASSSELRQIQGTWYCNTKNAHWTTGHRLIWQDQGRVNEGGPPLRSCLLGAVNPLEFYSLAVFYCLTNFLHQTLPQRAAQESQDGFAISRLLFDATNNMLFRRPWLGKPKHKERMALACPTICHLLTEQGASPNAQFGIDKDSAWRLMLEYGLTHLPRRSEFWRNFDFRGFAYTYSWLLVKLVQHGADVNTEVVFKRRLTTDVRSHRPTYSALAALETLYSPIDSMDSFAFTYQPYTGGESRSEELISFYEHLYDLMIHNGAVKELRTSLGGDHLASTHRSPDGTQSTLAPPRMTPRPNSTGYTKFKLKEMFGKWRSPKGSMET